MSEIGDCGYFCASPAGQKKKTTNTTMQTFTTGQVAPLHLGSGVIGEATVTAVLPQVIGTHYTLQGHSGRYTYSPVCAALVKVGGK